MIRQARRYLVGAVSSVTVISIAIVVFVLLVSAQVFRDWPIAALGGDNGQAAVSEANAVAASSAPAAVVAKTVKPGTSATPASAPATSGGDQSSGGAIDGAAPQDKTSVGSGAPPVTESEPVASAPQSSSPGSSPSSPSDSSSPAAPTESPPASSGGGNATGTSSGGSSKGSSGSKPPGQAVEEIVAPVTGNGGSTTAKVTETVNNTVDSVDETVTGGALKETGVTGLTEEVVNGVVGPESALGNTVDETANAIGGLLGGQH